MRLEKEDVFRFLESSGGAAVIAVFLGTMGGGLLNGWVQNDLQKRDFDRARLERLGEQEREVTERLYGLVGDSIVAAETLLRLTTEDFDSTRYSGDEGRRLREQVSGFVRESNASILRWRSGQRVLALQMRYYSRSKEIEEYWENVARAVDVLIACAEGQYEAYLRDFGDKTGSCEDDRMDVDPALDRLTMRLSSARSEVGGG